MNKALKVSLIAICCLAVLAAVIVPLALNWNAITGTIKGEAYYTYENVQEAYIKGFDEGSENLNEFKTQLDDIRNQLDLKTKTISEWTEKYNNLEKEKNAEIKKLNEHIDYLNGKIDSLNKKIQELNDIIKEKDITINNLNLQIQNLQGSIIDLNNEITRLKNILSESGIDFENMFFVTYLVKNSVWKTQLYQRDSSISLAQSPTISYLDFKNWTLEDGTEVNVDDLRINSDLTLIASFTISDNAFVFCGLDSKNERTVDESKIVSYAVGCPPSDSGFDSNKPEGYVGSGIDIVEIPSSYNGKPVIAVGDCAFYAARDVKKIILPESIKFIGSRAFSYCSATDINIPDNVTTIYKGAFAMSKVNSLVVPKSVTYIGQDAFSNSSLSKVVFSANVDEISDYAFNNCYNLTYVDMSLSSVKKINRYVFKNCVRLYTLSLNEGLTEIGSYAFSDSSLLGKKHSFVLPSTLTTLGDYFLGSNSDFGSLELTIKSNICLSIGHLNYSIDKANQAGTLRVPSSLVETYKSRVNTWGKWFQRIISLD